MNDRYLFKAKDNLHKEWHIGNLFKEPDGMYIREIHRDLMVRIDTSTICQCTGLKDKNGNLIWENDVVKGKYWEYGRSHRHIGMVKYISPEFKVAGVKQYRGYNAELTGIFEVIGNIFDNPELLESEVDNDK